jgi:hypothetical protein
MPIARSSLNILQRMDLPKNSFQIENAEDPLTPFVDNKLNFANSLIKLNVEIDLRKVKWLEMKGFK